MKPIGIQLYTVREAAKEDFLGVLKQIADIGYKGVEPAGLHGHEPAEIRKVIDDLGMVCCSSHGPLVTADNLTEQADIARTLGYDTIISGRGGDAWKTLDGIKTVAAEFQASAELLKSAGLKQGYHNHWWEMGRFDGKLGYEIFLESAPDVVGQLDVYWACNFGKVDVPKLLKKHPKRFPLLHVKDGPLVEKEPHTAVGSGKMDIPACVQAADPSVLRWLIVELDDCATDMMQAVRDSYAYLTGQGLAEGNK